MYLFKWKDYRRRTSGISEGPWCRCSKMINKIFNFIFRTKYDMRWRANDHFELSIRPISCQTVSQNVVSETLYANESTGIFFFFFKYRYWISQSKVGDTYSAFLISGQMMLLFTTEGHTLNGKALELFFS